MTGVTSLFLEQGIKGFFYIILAGTGDAAFRVQRHTIVRLIKVAEVCAVFYRHIIGLGFGALITFAGIKKATIFAAINIGLAMRAFIFAPNCANGLDFSSAAMTNHAPKITNLSVMNQISDPTTAAKAKYEIEQFLLVGTDWQLWEGERLLATISRTSSEFSVEWGKLIFAWWTDDSSNSWRVTAYQIVAAELQFTALRGRGRETIRFLLRDPLRWQQQPETLAIAERRVQFSDLFTQIISEHFNAVQIQRVRTRSKFSRAAPGQYVRVLLKQTNETILALGINAAEAQADIDNIITAGLRWVSEYQKPVARLWLCVPHGRSQTVLERLTLLAPAPYKLRVECFEINEKERSLLALRPVAQAELLHLYPRGLLWPEGNAKPPSLWRERIVKLAPDVIEVREKDKFESYEIRGLEFARSDQHERLWFGIAQRPDEITEKLGVKADIARKELTSRNYAQLENLVREIVAFRRADTADLRHSFYRLRTESWLECLLRRDIRALDATLDPRFVYAQIPTWLGEERAVMDLLTVNHEGRLVVIEIKAAEDANLPLQGLDYWLRVEQARVRGELARRGLFAGIEVADKSPLLYLVAPRLRFHRSFRFVTSCIAPEIEAYRIGLNTNWRAGIKVRDVEKLGAER
jgi:hypothetical protein